MNSTRYRFARFSIDYSRDAFDCGSETCNRWLIENAETAVKAGAAGVYVLLEEAQSSSRVVGYYAIAPTTVIRAELPRSAGGGAPDPVPGFLLAKLALDRTLQGDRESMWGTQLLVGALRRIVEAATVSGGRVIIVDADNERLVPFYFRHSFLPTKVSRLRLYMKVATARRVIEAHDDQ